MDYTIEESMIITGKKEVYAMRDERKCKNQWELKRQKRTLVFCDGQFSKNCHSVFMWGDLWKYSNL